MIHRDLIYKNNYIKMSTKIKIKLGMNGILATQEAEIRRITV
jgi:hypothetical protein